MAHKEMLNEFLRRLEAGDRSEELKHEIHEFLVEVAPRDMYAVEKSLLDAGLTTEDLIHRCSIHMDEFRQEQVRLREGLRPEHLMHKMLTDHEYYLAALDEVEQMNEEIQRSDDLSPVRAQRLLAAVLRLSEIEPHALCEDEAVFPEIERHGEVGPPQDLKMEHEELTRLLAELRGLAPCSTTMSFSEFKPKLNRCVRFITFLLRDHLFKEIYILYPLALRVITDESDWRRMGLACCKLGYGEKTSRETT